MATSSQPAAEDALLALMVADGTLAGVGPPQLFMPAEMKKEHVWISEFADLTQIPSLTAGTIPNVQRQEEYDIHVVVAIEKLGNDFKVIRDRGVVLCTAVAALVLNNHTLTNTVWHAELTAIERRSAALERQRFVDHDITIHCRQYLTGA